MRIKRTLAVLASAATAALAPHAWATISVDGSLDSDYGVPIVSQTINTSFGDSSFTANTGTHGMDSNGSELDAAYGVVQNGTLYLLFTGDFEANGNHLDLFFQSGSGGSGTLNAANGGALGSMNGSVFSTGFNPTLAFDANDYQGTLYLDSYNLVAGTHGYTGGSIPLSNGIGSTANDGGVAIALNNTNTIGVNGVSGTAVTDPSVPNAVTTGIEFGIPLAALGSPSGSINVMASINGGNNGYLSNQFLPGLPVGTGSIGGGTTPYTVAGKSGAFDFSTLPNEYFTVNVPATNTWITTGDGNWSNSANWTVGTVPNFAGASANFSDPNGGGVNVDGSFTVGSISFSGQSYVLAGDEPNHLTLDNGGNGNATITDYAGTHIIQTDLVLTSNTDVTVVNNGDTLIITGNISGNGALSSTNSGGGNGSSLLLEGNNTYTGGTIVNSGLIQIESPTAFPADSALTINASDVPDPTLDVVGNDITISSLSSITSPNTVSTGAIGLIINSAANAVTITYAGDPGNPSTFYGRLIDNTANGGGAASLVIASGSLTITGSSTGHDGSGNVINTAPASFTGTTTINNGATLTLAAAVYGGALSQTSSIINNGTLNIDDFESIGPLTNNGTISIGTGGTMQLRAGMGAVTLASAGLTLSGGAIDVNNDALVLTYTAGNDPIAAIRATAAAGHLISAAAATMLGTGVGYADGNTDTGTAAAANTILIRYTWLGDLNLDGSITNSDYTALFANLGNTNADWAQGDLNYDGTVNADDISLFQLGAAEAGTNTLSLPEPASAALLALPLLMRRRRRAR